MNDRLRIPDAETRARNIANLREAGRMLDLLTLDLDEIIALLDKGLREQRRARLLAKSKSVPTSKIES
ncbi:hypothetical protein [Chamaesiphon sp. OTE_75_metabat_556]|jgi:hypothetical protein|uniref:hypothetical protein n=1 Tax=Chamaesiphon sp. OTE_75_metabat_556 TaxID=2964692 RepID=UPI00286C14C5|nr:hypothetical protein [Chamaesiphon sp. OTE_75_metabat_556]